MSKRSNSLPNPNAVTSWKTALLFGAIAAIAIKQPFRPLELNKSKTDRTTSPAFKPHSLSVPTNAQGSSASTPSELAAGSWIAILKRVYEQFGEDRVLSVAASVTFYALLSIFPAIVALVSLYGLFADANTISEHLTALSGMMPGGALDIIGEQVKRIASKPHASLGFGFVLGLLTALWSANAGMKSVFDALNIVYDEKEKRSFATLNAISLVFTIGAIAFLILALIAVVVIPAVFNLIGANQLGELAVNIARWPLLMLVIVGALAVLYRYGPSREKPRWRWVTWGSGFAALAWIFGSMLFSWYVSKFGSYNETYGSLGAAIGFMTWIWISTTIILLGAEINAEMEHQTAKDTTIGLEKPIGTRGAAVADQVA